MSEENLSEWIEKHGTHDQSSHGRRKGSGGKRQTAKQPVAELTPKQRQAVRNKMKATSQKWAAEAQRQLAANPRGAAQLRALAASRKRKRK